MNITNTAGLTAQFEDAKAKWKDAVAECEDLKADIESCRAGGPGKRNDEAARRGLDALKAARARRRKFRKLAHKTGMRLRQDPTTEGA